MYSIQQASTAVRIFENVLARQPDVAWDGHPGASYAWTRAAARTNPKHLWVVLGEQTLPLAVLTMRSRFRSPLLFPVGYHLGGFQPLNGYDSNATAYALAGLLRRYGVYLPFCTRNLAFAVKAHDTSTRIREHDSASVVHFENPDEYLASRPRKLRATIRRAERAFSEMGGVIEQVLPSDVAAVWPHLVAIEAHGYRTSGQILNGHHAAFLHAALLESNTDDELELWVGRIEQIYVGYIVGIHSRQSTYLYTMAITREMAALSLGSAIFYRAIIRNLAQGRWVNLGTGRTLFKSRFATGEQQLYDVLLIPQYALGIRQLVDVMPVTKHGGRWW